MTAAASHYGRRLLSRVPLVFIILLLLLVTLAIISPRSVLPENLLNLVRQAGPLGLVAIGQTLVLISGGLDLSVGSTVILADVLAAQMINDQPERILPVIALVLLVGALIGAVNGLLITRFRVTPFIATLGMNFIVYGAALVYSGGAPGGRIPGAMRFVGNGFLFGAIPMGGLVLVVITLATAFLMRRSAIARRLVAVGANAQAALAAGVNVDRVILLAYVASGVFAAAGGLLLAAVIGIGTLEIGSDFLLGSIAAAVIGGTSLQGGKGTIWGTFGGALFLMVLYSILTVLALPSSGRRIAEGLIILGAIALYSRSRD